MNKIIKIMILMAVFNFGGCCSSDCKKIEKYFDVNGVTFAIKQITATYSDNSFSDSPLDSSVVINFDKFVIELNPAVAYYGCNSDDFDFGNLFVNSAYACKCAERGYEGSAERISEIQIFSSYQFNGTGTVNDTLSQYFDIDGFQEKAGYIRRTDLVTFINGYPEAFKKIRLILKVKPNGSLKHKFTVQYKQTNGETYTITTPTVEFNP